MKINIWSKTGNVVMSFGGDPAKGKPPLITVEIMNPQILFDEGTNKIQVVETK